MVQPIFIYNHRLALNPIFSESLLSAAHGRTCRDPYPNISLSYKNSIERRVRIVGSRGVEEKHGPQNQLSKTCKGSEKGKWQSWRLQVNVPGLLHTCCYGFIAYGVSACPNCRSHTVCDSTACSWYLFPPIVLPSTALI